jgi:hypothetical protein
MGGARLDWTHDKISAEIHAAEKALGDRERRLWDRVRIQPSRWHQQQYPGVSEFWVVGILGDHCLYLNEVEGGWGWGRYVAWGSIAECHWQQDEIHHVIAQTLFAIDNGGVG